MKRAAWLLWLCGCGSSVGSDATAVIHGLDDRRDYFELDDPRLRELTARTVVALIDTDRIDATDPADLRLDAPTLAEVEGLCEGERYGAEPTAARCSGTLIGDDLVLTAGHCMWNGDCEATSFVFGYYRESAAELHRIEAADVFGCAEVVASEDGPSELGELDWAVVRLDRKATPRFLPAPLRLDSAPLAQDQPLALISFGAGLPAKIDLGGRVIDPRGAKLDFFLSNSDAFARSSGGAMFDRAGQALVGLVVRGAGDWEETEAGCRRARVCPEGGCDGHWPYEEVQYAHHVAATGS